MQKINVVDCPLFRFLAKQIPVTPLCDWNFTKILVSPDGTSFTRYPSSVEPLAIEKAIVVYLGLDEGVL